MKENVSKSFISPSSWIEYDDLFRAKGKNISPDSRRTLVNIVGYPPTLPRDPPPPHLIFIFHLRQERASSPTYL